MGMASYRKIEQIFPPLNQEDEELTHKCAGPSWGPLKSEMAQTEKRNHGGLSERVAEL